MVRLAAYGGVSSVLAGYVVLSAFRQRSNFFSAAVYLSKSNACMMILWNFGVFLTILFGRALQTIFFGPLRLLEIERLHERAWYAVTESLLALTIFREEFDTSFVILFTTLLFLKVFHWLAADRVEMMEQQPSISRIFHFRMVTVLSTLWVLDMLLIVFAAESILMDGPSVMIMFASEYMIMLATLLGTTLKYGVNVHDLRSEVPWENRSVYIFYIELMCDFIKLATYLCFFSLILTFYGLPLNVLRDLWMTARSFIVKIGDLLRYRNATRNMDERYPNATHEELERMSDKTCIICREEMEARTPSAVPQAAGAGAAAQAQTPAARGTAVTPSEARAVATPAPAGRQGPNDTPKKLPCGHIFHFHCLRSWLERQQSCPTCRRPVLAAGTSTTAQAQAAGRPGQPPQPPQALRGGQAPGQPAPPQPGQVPRPGPAAGPTPTLNGYPALPGSHMPRIRSDGTLSYSRSGRPRAGLDNPLVAFQTSPTTLPPSIATRARPVAPLSAAGVAPATSASQPSAQTAAPVPTPTTSSPAPQSDQEAMKGTAEAAPESDERTARRVKMEAAARARQAQASPAKGPAAASSAKPFRPSPLSRSGTGTDDTGALPRGVTPSNPSNSPSQPEGDGRGAGLKDVPGGQTSDRAAETSNTATRSRPQAYTEPRLIPLFDPSNPSRPSPYAKFFPNLMQPGGIGLLSGSAQSAAVLAPAPGPTGARVPDNLSSEQMAMLADVTKEGLAARMQLLQNTQETLQVCMRQMQEAMGILSNGDLEGVLKVVSELNDTQAQQAMEGNSAAADSTDKGKGRAEGAPDAAS